MKKYKSQCKAVEVTLNSKEENSEEFYLDFVQEFALRIEQELEIYCDLFIYLVHRCHHPS